MEFVHVVVGADGRAIEILKNEKHSALATLAGYTVGYMLRSLATEQIRLAVFKRDGYACTHCGAPVCIGTGHMHERLHRGRGGEISVNNSTTLCGGCHANNPVAGHGKRKVQWSHA